MSAQDPAEPRTVEEYRSVNESLHHQLRMVKDHQRSNRLPLTILFLGLFALVFAGGIGLVFQQAEQAQQNRTAYNECQGRNANLDVTRHLWTRAAVDASTPALRLDFAEAAAGIRAQDCSAYR